MSAAARELARNVERVSAFASSVQGWLNDQQGRMLYEAAATVPIGEIVEIGSWKGRSTVWLAAGARVSGRRVYAIDPHVGSREDPVANTLAEFRANIERAGLAAFVEPVVMTSAAAADRFDRPIGVLFIDGDHSHAGVTRDVDLWLPKVADGGVVLFHDVATSGYIGPRRVFRKRICCDPQFQYVRRVGSMSVARRTMRRNLSQAVRCRVFGLMLYRYDLERLVKAAARRLRKAALRPPAQPLADH